ncbi:MAG TPA: S-layer homology domain-containing protein [Thermoanaerobaculia bacterium]|nr:S-layer homology domain-containing protein [Thermoanaerobaculia bacterium]
MNAGLSVPRPGRTLLVLGIVVVATIVLPAPGSGQLLSTLLGRTDLVGPGASPEAPSYGTASESLLVIGADAFELASGAENPPDLDNTGRTCAVAGSQGSCVFLATINLSSGALITSVDLEACDGDAVGQFGFAVAQFSVPVQTGTFVSPVFASGATPGCAVFPVIMTRTVNNAAEKLVFDVNVQPGTSLGFTTARVHYKLQVSPPPATPTFGDVPANNQFFQYVEALAASGITGGCGGGNYCPNNPVTRGQMAAFLSKALGLHYPN